VYTDRSLRFGKYCRSRAPLPKLARIDPGRLSDSASYCVRSWSKWKHQIFNALIAVQNFFKSEEESLGGTVKRLFARIAQSICRLALAKICSNTLLFRRLGPSVERI
jgi:hypothetical protein